MNLPNQLSSLLSLAAQVPETTSDAVPVPSLAARSIAAGTLTWGEALQFLGVGLFIVFATLVGLWIVCELMGLFFKRIDRPKGQPPAGVPALADTTSKPPPGDPAQTRCAALPAAGGEAPPTPIVAVITAAVAAALDNAPHRIVSVQEAAPATDVPLAVFAAAAAVLLGEKPHRILGVRPVDMAWAREGRRELLGAQPHVRR